jgi:hypothetical protein
MNEARHALGLSGLRRHKTAKVDKGFVFVSLRVHAEKYSHQAGL